MTEVVEPVGTSSEATEVTSSVAINVDLKSDTDVEIGEILQNEAIEENQEDISGVIEDIQDEEELDESVIDAEFKAVTSENLPPPIDPKLCNQCKKEPHKYKCPKCSVKTCSLPCSKQHKEDKNCDGVRGPFAPVSRVSEYKDGQSIEDQQFLHQVKEAILTKEESDKQRAQMVDNVPKLTPDGRRHQAASAQERYLIQNAFRRRIWLAFTDDKGGEDNSRHEQFSDTVFWTLDLIFRKQMEDGSVSEYKHRVHQVPESIRVETVLRQFTRPKPFGPLVSKPDLDLEKLSPFIAAGSTALNVFMPVPMPDMDNKYYPMNIDVSILDNTRNRLIVNHPVFIVVLDNEFTSFETITEEEMQMLREKNRTERLLTQPPRAPREGGGYSGRGGSGGFRGGGRGFGRGGSMPRRGGMKRFGEDNDKERDGGHRSGGAPDFKRGRRGGPPMARRGGRGWQNREPEFDPFEPFEGPGRVPLDSLSDDWAASRKNQNSDSAQSSWDNVVKKDTQQATSAAPADS